jgi:Ca2+/H+ antiporter
MTSSPGRRPLRDAAILTAFVLASQLVVVPLVGGTPTSDHVASALVSAVLVLPAAYLIGRAADQRRRDD